MSAKPGIRECPYCKRFNRWGHYVPPMMGDEGFAACASLWRTDDEDPEVARMNWKYDRPAAPPAPRTPTDNG